jgi:hypothetical protein
MMPRGKAADDPHTQTPLHPGRNRPNPVVRAPVWPPILIAGDTPMTAYRFLWLDEKGHVPKSTHAECTTDQQAIDLAGRQTGDYEAIEIWDRPRFVYHRANPDKVED